MKLADVLHTGLKEDQDIDEIQRKSLNEIEVPPDSTFVTNSIYWTVENLNIYKSKGSQQALSQLLASKRNAGVNQSTRFSAALNRGGLYNQLNNQKESLSYLRIFSPKYGSLDMAVINARMIVEKLKTFSYTRVFFSDIKHSRSSRPEVFCEKGVFNNFGKFTGRHQCQSLFFWHRCFPVNFVKFLRTPFCIEHLWWLFLVFF